MYVNHHKRQVLVLVADHLVFYTNAHVQAIKAPLPLGRLLSWTNTKKRLNRYLPADSAVQMSQLPTKKKLGRDRSKTSWQQLRRSQTNTACLGRAVSWLSGLASILDFQPDDLKMKAFIIFFFGFSFLVFREVNMSMCFFLRMAAAWFTFFYFHLEISNEAA